MKKLFPLTFVLMAVLVGCTSVKVLPIAKEHRISSVAIKENLEVEGQEFLGVLITGFERHGIEAKVISAKTEVKDAYVVTYTAKRDWDLAVYLSHATINIHKDGQLVASAIYHLRAGGGLSMTKWKSVKEKIDPVIDQLLKDVKS